MRGRLLPAFATLGAVQGWLLLDAVSGEFDRPSRPLSASVQEWLTPVAAGALAAAAVAALLARARTPTIARFVAYFFAATFLAFWVPILLATFHLRWNGYIDLAVVVIPLTMAVVSLPFYALPFFAWRAGRARAGSLIDRAAARGLWVAVAVAVVIATSLTSHERGWLFNDLVGRFGPPNIGVCVELGLEVVALVAVALLVARDVGDAVRVSRIDPRALVRTESHARETLDLGVGTEAYAEVLEVGPTYRQSAAGLAVIGDVEVARRALRRRLWLDGVAVAVGVAALSAFRVSGR